MDGFHLFLAIQEDRMLVFDFKVTHDPQLFHHLVPLIIVQPLLQPHVVVIEPMLIVVITPKSVSLGGYELMRSDLALGRTRSVNFHEQIRNLCWKDLLLC